MAVAATAWSPPTERLKRVRAFMNDRVLPHEQALDREDEEAEALLDRSRRCRAPTRRRFAPGQCAGATSG